jgi:hypothetical protein
MLAAMATAQVEAAKAALRAAMEDEIEASVEHDIVNRARQQASTSFESYVSDATQIAANHEVAEAQAALAAAAENANNKKSTDRSALEAEMKAAKLRLALAQQRAARASKSKGELAHGNVILSRSAAAAKIARDAEDKRRQIEREVEAERQRLAASNTANGGGGDDDFEAAMNSLNNSKLSELEASLRAAVAMEDVAKATAREHLETRLTFESECERTDDGDDKDDSDSVNAGYLDVTTTLSASPDFYLDVSAANDAMAIGSGDDDNNNEDDVVLAGPARVADVDGTASFSPSRHAQAASVVIAPEASAADVAAETSREEAVLDDLDFDFEAEDDDLAEAEAVALAAEAERAAKEQAEAVKRAEAERVAADAAQAERVVREAAEREQRALAKAALKEKASKLKAGQAANAVEDQLVNAERAAERAAKQAAAQEAALAQEENAARLASLRREAEAARQATEQLVTARLPELATIRHIEAAATQSNVTEMLGRIHSAVTQVTGKVVDCGGDTRKEAPLVDQLAVLIHNEAELLTRVRVAEDDRSELSKGEPSASAAIVSQARDAVVHDLVVDASQKKDELTQAAMSAKLDRERKAQLRCANEKLRVLGSPPSTPRSPPVLRSDPDAASKPSAFKGLVESLQRRHAFTPANSNVPEVLAATSAADSLKKREQVASEQVIACRSFAAAAKARAEKLSSELGGKNAALQDAIGHDASAAFVRMVAKDVYTMQLELLQDEMDVGVFSGLADATERLAVVDSQCEEAIAALVHDDDGPCVTPFCPIYSFDTPPPPPHTHTHTTTITTITHHYSPPPLSVTSPQVSHC